MNKKIRYLSSLIILFSSVTEISYAVELADMDKEITRIRKELASVTSQRQTVKIEAGNDLKEQTGYRKKMDERFDLIKSEVDSLEKVSKIFQQKSDSISAVIASINAKEKQYDLLQETFRNRLITICDQILKQSKLIPPLSASGQISPLTFLKSELSAKNIDNVEGLQRIMQIIKNYDDLTSSIQISQGPSPISTLQGNTYRLRIGCFFEAIVESNGGRYALWNGSDADGKEIWSIQNDPAGASQILKAINIREGKALPSFAEIPSISAKEGD